MQYYSLWNGRDAGKPKFLLTGLAVCSVGGGRIKAKTRRVRTEASA